MLKPLIILVFLFFIISKIFFVFYALVVCIFLQAILINLNIYKIIYKKFAHALQIFYTKIWIKLAFLSNKKGGVLVKGKNTNDKKPKLDPIIIVAIINGLFSLATALINVLL